MAVFVTGDLHGGLDIQKLRDWEAGERLTRSDFLIVAGDFGTPGTSRQRNARRLSGLSPGPTRCCLLTATTSATATGRSAPTRSGTAA